MNLLMEISMMDNFRMEIDKDKAAILGLIIAIIKVNGLLIKWMVKVFMQIQKLN